MTGLFNDTQLSGVRPELGQVRAARRMTKKIFLINSVPQSKTEGLYSYLIGDAWLCLPMPKIVFPCMRELKNVNFRDPWAREELKMQILRTCGVASS